MGIYDNPDLNLYFELFKSLGQMRTEAEKRNVGRELAKLLNAESVSVRRCVKYTLRDKFALGEEALRQWSQWGPPSDGETAWWENYFNQPSV